MYMVVQRSRLSPFVLFGDSMLRAGNVSAPDLLRHRSAAVLSQFAKPEELVATAEVLPLIHGRSKETSGRHRGELFPRVGFIVTNMTAGPEGVVRFYNGRGTAEQWIKEGKYALNWTRLSCHRFVANRVRLSLFVLAQWNFLRLCLGGTGRCGACSPTWCAGGFQLSPSTTPSSSQEGESAPGSRLVFNATGRGHEDDEDGQESLQTHLLLDTIDWLGAPISFGLPFLPIWEIPVCCDSSRNKLISTDPPLRQHRLR